MKKVLVTGASGSIGLEVIRYLLSEGKYEITALDLNNQKSIKKLKKYRNRVNIIYGDITNNYDKVLIEALVRDHDFIIHLASVLPPLGEFSHKLSRLTEYVGTKNIIDAINTYNKDCFMIYASSTSIYNDQENTIKSKIDKSNLNNFSINKYETELLIKKELKNYAIFRIPLVLSNIKDVPFIYNIKKDELVEVTTNKDAAYAFVKALEYKNDINNNIYNIGMGSEGRLIYNDILKNILINYGISTRYILSRMFLEKNYHSPVLLDSDNLDNLIHYRFDNLNNYYKRIKNRGKKRYIQKILAKPLVYFKNKN